MAKINNKKLKAIKADAAKKAQATEPEYAAALQKDFEELMIQLNEKIDARMEDFRSQALVVLQEAYPTRPSDVLRLVDEESEKVLGLMQGIMSNMESIRYAPFQKIAASVIKDMVDICADTVGEQYTRAAKRVGIEVQ